MKIEKLTENKIRIILKQDDFKDKSIDLHTIMTTTAESQGLLLDILAKAKKEVGFDTDGCRLLIEAFSTSEDIFVFTVTKFAVNNEEAPSTNFKPKKLKVSRKRMSLDKKFAIYEFANFDNFCDFCRLIGNSKKLVLKNFVESSSLYVFNDCYYLVLNNINVNNPSISAFSGYIAEFAKSISYTDTFEGKLKEYGKCIMRKNAIRIGIKYFAKV